MNVEQFTKAINIISGCHSVEVKINSPINGFVGDLGTKCFTIHITQCPPVVVRELIDAGYRLGMTANGLSVDK